MVVCLTTTSHSIFASNGQSLLVTGKKKYQSGDYQGAIDDLTEYLGTDYFSAEYIDAVYLLRGLSLNAMERHSLAAEEFDNFFDVIFFGEQFEPGFFPKLFYGDAYFPRPEQLLKIKETYSLTGRIKSSNSEEFTINGKWNTADTTKAKNFISFNSNGLFAESQDSLTSHNFQVIYANKDVFILHYTNFLSLIIITKTVKNKVFFNIVKFIYVTVVTC